MVSGAMCQVSGGARARASRAPGFILGSTAAPAVVRHAPASNTPAAETQKRQAGICNRNRDKHKESQNLGLGSWNKKKRFDLVGFTWILANSLGFRGLIYLEL